MVYISYNSNQIITSQLNSKNYLKYKINISRLRQDEKVLILVSVEERFKPFNTLKEMCK